MTGGGSGAGSGLGGSGGGAVMTTIFSSTGGGLGASAAGAGGALNLAAISGWSLKISSSRNSALILSSELDGTLAAVMPSVLALARIALLSKPSFFEMS